MKRILLIVALLTAAAFAWQTAALTAKAANPGPQDLTTLLPQGALLFIESPDFAALLKRWNTSAEQQAWLASSSYSVFSNSRLFGRLSDAQTEFASTAGLPAGALLPQVAGRQSVFAWYDIGNLEFLYITRLTPAQQARITLVQQRSKWKQRQAAGIPFYIRTTTAPNAFAARTVAFATAGDLVLLSTREDLLVGALTQLAHPTPADALRAEPWFADASAVLGQQGSTTPALHMVLNLDRLVRSPYFRSYWVQQNITEMKQYRVAVSDLYIHNDVFEDQRALILKSPPEAVPTPTHLAALAALAPPGGVYRATATPDAGQAVTALEEKLLGRETLAHTTEEAAPDPSLSGPQAGSASDLDTRIDSPPPVSATFSNQALTEAVQAAGLESILTWSAAALPQEKTSLWVPIHSAVVLRAQHPWNPETIAAALQQSLRGTLTAGNLGLTFTSGPDHTFALNGPKPLFFTTRGNDLLLADDPSILGQLLTPHPALSEPPSATVITGFDHTAQRPPFLRLAALIDGTNVTKPDPPAFFSGNLGSLSEAFQTLQSERFTQFPEGSIVRQTVTYTFAH